MELFEKINRAFGGWYEGLFGGGEDVRPKDILRKIFVAMEENRKEHLDDKIYVPNHYILEIAVDDEEEKEYLRSFLIREELETALRRYCKQNHYEIRGTLEFTIKEVDVDAEARRPEKVRIRCRYDSRLASAKQEPEPSAPCPTSGSPGETGPGLGDARAPAHTGARADNPTVYDVDYSAGEMGTVPSVALARLRVQAPGKAPFEVPIAAAAVTVGRSPRAGNDIVIEDDVRISRRHARIELDGDGQFTIYDLDTTNGTRVNGRKIDNCALKAGDEILLGATRIVFLQEHDAEPASRVESRESGGTSNAYSPARLVRVDGDQDVDDFVLANETLIGRGSTNHVVLADRSVATRHVLVRRGEPSTLEVLDADHLTLLNGAPLKSGDSQALTSGDRIGVGTVTLRYEEGRA